MLKREPDKKRFINAINHVEQKEIPFFEYETEYAIVQKILGKKVPPVPSFMLPADMYKEYLLATSMDMACIWTPWWLGRGEHVDENGKVIHTDGRMATYDDLKQIEYPDLNIIKQRIEDVFEALHTTKIGICCTVETSPLVMYKAMKFEEYYIKLATEPEFIEEFQKILDEFLYKQAELITSYSIDLVRMDANLCSNKGPLTSFDMMEQFQFPVLQDMVNMTHNKNIKAVLHTDGVIQDFIPRFIDLGFDMLHPIEGCNGQQSIYEIKEQYGAKIALHGNIDVSELLAFGTQEEVVKDVREHIDTLRHRGGYIVGSSHDIHEKVDVDNFTAMIETIIRYE